MKTTTVASQKLSKAPICAPSIFAIDLGKYKSVACHFDMNHPSATEVR
jgi:hypothetical protein